MSDIDLVVEAAIEDLKIKSAIFKELDELCPEHTILASNTSSLAITQIGAATKRPDKVIGMHFFNPAPVMKLLELINGIATSDETYAKIEQLSKDLGKTPVKVNDFPGLRRQPYRNPDAQRSYPGFDGRRCFQRRHR